MAAHYLHTIHTSDLFCSNRDVLLLELSPKNTSRHWDIDLMFDPHFPSHAGLECDTSAVSMCKVSHDCALAQVGPLALCKSHALQCKVSHD